MDPMEQYRRWNNSFEQQQWAFDVTSLERFKALAERYPESNICKHAYEKRLAEFKAKYPNVK